VLGSRQGRRKLDGIEDPVGVPGTDTGSCQYAIPNCMCEEEGASPFVHGRLDDRLGPGDEEDDEEDDGEEYDDDDA
jgi:hypothetical protein